MFDINMVFFCWYSYQPAHFFLISNAKINMVKGMRKNKPSNFAFPHLYKNSNV